MCQLNGVLVGDPMIELIGVGNRNGRNRRLRQLPRHALDHQLALRLTGGQSLSVAFTNADKAKVGRTFPVTVSGGTLTVTVNGEVVASLDASGEWRYEEGATDDVIVFSFAASEDGGFADLARSRSNRGVLLLVR